MALEPITRQEKIIAGQDLTPITRMEKFLKQYGGGSGGVTSWNDLTDKPFGEVTTVKEVLAEQKAENLEYMDGLGYLVPQSIGLVVGGKYIVTYNGVDYECTGIDGSVANSTGNVFLGDISLVTPGQEEIYDEPFMLVDMPEDGVTGIVPTAAQVAFESISIRQEVTTVQKMSGKYVEGMGYKEKKTETLFDGTVTTSGGFAPQYTPVNFKVVEGGIYEVTHDDKTYTVEAVSDGYGGFYIGNITLFNSPGSGSGDIPFCYANGFYCASQDGDHAVKIIGTFDVVNQIDEEFLPKSTVIIPVYLAPGFNGGSEEANLICDKTVSDILDLIKSGKTVLIKWGVLVCAMHSYMDMPFKQATFVMLNANESFVRIGHTVVFNEQEIKLYSKAPDGIYLTAPNGDYYLLQVDNSGAVKAYKTSYPGNGM